MLQNIMAYTKMHKLLTTELYIGHASWKGEMMPTVEGENRKVHFRFDDFDFRFFLVFGVSISFSVLLLAGFLSVLRMFFL